jgi:hypothetical protein
VQPERVTLTYITDASIVVAERQQGSWTATSTPGLGRLVNVDAANIGTNLFAVFAEPGGRLRLGRVSGTAVEDIRSLDEEMGEQGHFAMSAGPGALHVVYADGPDDSLVAVEIDPSGVEVRRHQIGLSGSAFPSVAVSDDGGRVAVVVWRPGDTGRPIVLAERVEGTWKTEVVDDRETPR